MWCALAIALMTAAAPSSPAVDEVDRLALAATLLSDGHAARARAVLDEVDPRAEGIDTKRHHLLRGLTDLALRDYPAAAAAFAAAVAAGDVAPATHLLWAQAAFHAGDDAAVITALDRAGNKLASDVDAIVLRGVVLRRQGQPAAAWALLDRAYQARPGAADIAFERLGVLAELGLGQAAVDAATAWLVRPEATADDAVRAAELLRRGHLARPAAEVLELAALRFAPSRDLAVQRARVLVELGLSRAASSVIADAAATLDPALYLDAAELARRTGDDARARHYNVFVPDPRAKLRQRLGLHIDAERFEEASALANRAERLGLDRDDALVYGLAYAELRAGKLKAAAERLRGITDPQVFARAAELRKAIELCAASDCE